MTCCDQMIGFAFARLLVKTAAPTLSGPAVDDDGDIGLAAGLQADGDAGRFESLGCGDAHGHAPFIVSQGDSRRDSVDERGPSGRPSAMFMDWMAAPAVPLTRLSSAATTTTRFAARSIASPSSAVLAPSTSAVRGN